MAGLFSHRAGAHGAVRDMTQGPIARQLLLFSLPLMVGNIFQMLYNTVDVIVVGNFVGTQALAAVGSTTMILNMLVFFFNGFSLYYNFFLISFIYFNFFFILGFSFGI